MGETALHDNGLYVMSAIKGKRYRSPGSCCRIHGVTLVSTHAILLNEYVKSWVSSVIGNLSEYD